MIHIVSEYYSNFKCLIELFSINLSFSIVYRTLLGYTIRKCIEGDYMQFKDRLRFLREATGKSQKECASALGVEYANYNKWENGKAPNYETLCHIADYFNTTTDYLLGRSNCQFASQYSKKEIVNIISSYLSHELEMLFSNTVNFGSIEKTVDEIFSDFIEERALQAIKRCKLCLENIDMFVSEQNDNGKVYDGNKILLFLDSESIGN